MIKLYEKESMYKVQNSLFWNFKDENGAGTDHKFGCTFLSTSQCKGSQAGGKLGQWTDDTGITVPLGEIVVQFINDPANGSGQIDIYVDQEIPINWSSSTILADNMLKVASYKCADLAVNNRFGFQMYYENGSNPNQITDNRFYFRILAFAVNTASDTDGFSDYLESNDNVLYDSKQDNFYVGQGFISQAFKYETDGAEALVGQYYSGLVPTFYMSDLTGADSSEYAVSSIRGNFIYDDTQAPGVVNRDVIGLLKYSITSLDSDLQQIFGGAIDETTKTGQVININPNGWDRFSNNNYGIDEIFGNNTNYDIQITNLPIRSYSSTTDNNVGTQTTSIFTLNNHFSGSMTEINSGSLIRSIYPPNLKYINLRNDRPLNLNNLDVKIVRGGTNQQAVEIEDAKIELLFN
jgi:hypothetical protein